MKLLADVIKKAEEKENARNAFLQRKKEVEQLFVDIAKKHKEELETISKHVEVSKFGEIVRLAEYPKSFSSSAYKIEISSTRIDGKRYTLNIGLNANSASGSKKIPFDYNSTNIQLTLLFENALRLLASMKLNRIV
jgi:hypothetical protein